MISLENITGYLAETVWQRHCTTKKNDIQGPRWVLFWRSYLKKEVRNLLVMEAALRFDHFLRVLL